jgi:AAA ATPase domain
VSRDQPTNRMGVCGMAQRSKHVAQLVFLGAQRIEIGSEVITPEAERLFGLIVRLCVPLGRLTSRETMMDTLWPDVDEVLARHSLRQTVYKAREMGLVVESGEDGLRLDPRHWACDWEDVTGEIGGEWLEHYEPAFSDALSSWVVAQRVGVHALVRPRMMRLMQTARSAGELLQANRFAQQLLAIDSLNEEATLIRAELMAMQGAKVDALKLLDAYLLEIGRMDGGRDAALPAMLLRKRIAEKLPAMAYQHGGKHQGGFVGRTRELKRLTGGLFDARGGRGGAVLLHGIDGMGKTRLVYEVRKSALLQGMRTLELSCDSAPSVMPFALLRTLVTRALECRGASGIEPDAMTVLREWITSREFAPDDCPLAEIEDLLEAVSEDTPMLILLEQGEQIDAESLGRLDRIYRKGVVRHHTLILTTRTRATPTYEPVELTSIERLSLRPLTTVDVRSIVAAYAAAEQPRATQDQVAFAAVFAEGVPMYGIEMLGLMLDDGAPDVIPWRVQVSVDRAARELSELQLRMLYLTAQLGKSARQEVVAEVLQAEPAVFATALDDLEFMGFVVCDEGVLRAIGVMADEAERKLKPNVIRRDALRGAGVVELAWHADREPQDLFVSLRLLAISRSERKALRLLDRSAGELTRALSGDHIIFEVDKLLAHVETRELSTALNLLREQISSGYTGAKTARREGEDRKCISTLPVISQHQIDTANEMASRALFDRAIDVAHDPAERTETRLTEGLAALIVADNLHADDLRMIARQAIDSVRYAPDVNQLEVARADMIFYATSGDRPRALLAAERVSDEARKVLDIRLACTGLRNAAECYQTFGRISDAQAAAHESRSLASKLAYPAQIAFADIKLADMAIDEMDADSADRYLDSAEDIVANHRIKVQMLLADIKFSRCWARVIRRDFSAARKFARSGNALIKDQVVGNGFYYRTGAKLACYTGPCGADIRKQYGLLRNSIGRTPYSPNEERHLAALALVARSTRSFGDTDDFVRSNYPRLVRNRGHLWPFLRDLVDSADASIFPTVQD